MVHGPSDSRRTDQEPAQDVCTPSGQYLYITVVNGFNGINAIASIFQYDLWAGDAQSIENSKIERFSPFKDAKNSTDPSA